MHSTTINDHLVTPRIDRHDRAGNGNSDLLQSRIRNYKRMAERRVVFGLGVTYQTPHAKLQAIPGWIEAIIRGQDLVRFDRAHFQAFGDYALQFEIVYYVLDPDYNRYMDIQQAIILAIHQKFEAEGVVFAYPTQTLFVEQTPGPAPREDDTQDFQENEAAHAASGA